MFRGSLTESKVFKKYSRTLLYLRTRQHFPMASMHFRDDRDHLPEAEKVLVDWPAAIKKPRVALMRDYDPYPRWTKFCRFLENNSIPYEFYDLQTHDWLEKAKDFDIFIGILSSEFYHLQEMRKKYFILEKYLGKSCFPSFEHILIYEDKTLEAFISHIVDGPFAPTHIFYDENDALQAIQTLPFPIVSKIVPGSGSGGVEWVRDQKQAARIIKHAFSRKGRATYAPYFRQKNYVYFQEFVPNDGYDIRVILVNNWAFGYYRKVLKGDFRASGMNLVEKRALPEEAIRTAWELNRSVNSPLLVVDMVHGLDDRYYVIEYSPICQMETPEQLHVNGVPGTYIIEEDKSIHFREGKYWVHELALREFFLRNYLPKTQRNLLTYETGLQPAEQYQQHDHGYSATGAAPTPGRHTRESQP
ncbi:ATP-grasp domain-containing protein [Aggregatilinea lenta]|uniref:ATP-grasp domain-containing protein n=1 Tax=Aggregatilinea lenta TaxID=913108 RepID=UPI000E5AB46F|nr:ATP-dependent carboxylate-amine ligase [Aggregatilinea lenta]